MRRLIPRDLSSDLAASLVVFLVAMPLCLGIALASGVPAGMGLISGIVGGIVVGALSGSPLQVTGPAAGLAVIVNLGALIGHSALRLFISRLPELLRGSFCGASLLAASWRFSIAIGNRNRWLARARAYCWKLATGVASVRLET